MASDPSALLVADIGSIYTHVVLIDQVAGEYRAIARAQAHSTIEAPFSNVWIGVREAIRKIERITARQLTQEHSPIMPQKPTGNGIDDILFISSAAGTLPIVIAAISEETSGDSLRRVANSTYSVILDSITFDESREQVVGQNESLIDKQLISLVRLPVATILMAGGIEGGNITPLERLAHMLAFTILRPERQTDREYAHVVFAGNSDALESIHESLSTIAPISPVANIRPTMQEENLFPARQELVRLYREKVLPKLPGYDTLRSISTIPIRSTSECYIPMAQFLTKNTQRHVLLADVGSLTTSGYAAYKERVALSVISNAGTGYGILGILDQSGPEAIKQWLPFEITDQALYDRALNIVLRPQIIPITQEELFIAQAFAREALRLIFNAIYAEWNEFEFDLVVATGGVLRHTSHPAEALFMILDVLPVHAESQTLVTDIYLDRDGLIPIAGALVWNNVDASFCILEKDALRNGPLASCVVIHDTGKAGSLAVEAELTPIGGQSITIPVMHGEIRRIALPPNRRATLRLRPAAGIRIGANRAGEEVQSEIAAIQGSTLGIVIDARGRPLNLDTKPQKRQEQIWGWMAQLGAVPSTNPYTVLPEERQRAIQPESQELIPAEISEAPAPIIEQPTEIPAWLQEDMQQQGLIQPPPEEFGIEQMPDWLMNQKDEYETPDGVLDLEQRSELSDPNDFADLRAELQEEEQKSKRRWFRRK